jgi:protein-disulfide isomerase
MNCRSGCLRTKWRPHHQCCCILVKRRLVLKTADLLLNNYLPKPKPLPVLLALFSGLLLATSSLAQPASASDKAGTDQAVKQQIRQFVARTGTLIPLKDIQIAEFGPPDSHGLRKVVVNLLSGEAKVSKTFYLTADNKEILEGTLQQLTPDPWKDVRNKLQAAIEHGPSNGPASAPVVLVEFSDFECPFCRQLNPAIERLQKQHASQIRWIFLNYPLVKIHPWARAGAIAGACVADQSADAFWKFEPMVYEHQQEIKPATAQEQLRSLAVAAGAAADTYDACALSPEAANRVDASIAQGESLGVSGTPTLFVNGRRVVGGVSFDSLEAAVANELDFARAAADPPSGTARPTRK